MPSSRGDIPLLVQSQTFVTTVNEAIEQLSVIGAGGVLGFQIDTPPGGPSEGDAYVIGTSPTGAWAGEANNLAHWLNGAWVFYPAFNGLNVFNISGPNFVWFNGTVWAVV